MINNLQQWCDVLNHNKKVQQSFESDPQAFSFPTMPWKHKQGLRENAFSIVEENKQLVWNF